MRCHRERRANRRNNGAPRGSLARTPFDVQHQPWPGLATDMHQTPIGRPGQPAEIAVLYMALADASPSYTAGNVFGATGGNAAA